MPLLNSAPAPGQTALPFGVADSAADLTALALALGARTVGGWSREEEALADAAAVRPTSARVGALWTAVGRGEDPLGDGFCALHSPEARRPMGATYTPNAIAEAMTAWAGAQESIQRVVDPGAGSGRFLVAAGRAFPDVTLVGSELDPHAALLARGHLAAAGLAERSQVVVGDYRALRLPPVDGRTLYLGNPPYVRHHLISPEWKDWLARVAARRGLRASKLAGLHVHFFLATAELAKPGDLGAFVTSSEWLDVNYGQVVRDLLLSDLGLTGLHLIEPTATPFEDAQTTAVVTTFAVGSRPDSVALRRVEHAADLGVLPERPAVHRDRLAEARRWTPLTRAVRQAPAGFVELGELCRVHRGQVTGANKVWIAGSHSTGLPESVLFPTVTRAQELFRAGAVLSNTHLLRRVIDLPADLDSLEPHEQRAAEQFLETARAMGAHEAYTARHRRVWWAVGLREPAPILATYMARRPPAFVQNDGEARHINVAHGLYPRLALSDAALTALASYLGQSVSLGQGRTYAGGLTKFEPKEMERLMVPGPEVLQDPASQRVFGIPA